MWIKEQPGGIGALAHGLEAVPHGVQSAQVTRAVPMELTPMRTAAVVAKYRLGVREEGVIWAIRRFMDGDGDGVASIDRAEVDVILPQSTVFDRPHGLL